MEKKLKIYSKRIFFVGISIIAILELTLFLSGRYLLWQRRVTRGEPKAIHIVCVGDSHTFGVGTSILYSYPAQLERLLTLNNHKQKFFVMNLGIPGASTKRQAQEIESFFNTNKAEIVLLLTGRNNDFEIIKGQNPSFLSNIKYGLENLRSFKFLKVMFNRIFRKNNQQDNNYTPAYKESIVNYSNLYLARIRKLCREKGAKLALLSYYNSSDDTIKEFAHKYNILYFDLTNDFNFLFKAEDSSKYLSLDMSHMNRYGYKFFAEKLYERLFLKQAYLGIKINPLLQRIREKEFYLNDKEIGRMVKAQQERIEQSKNTGEYPFELVHLGHIYIEIGDDEAARDCYWKALLSSNYSNNNTIVSPIINWYLKRGRNDEALKIYEEILLHNPENGTAKYYRD
jgi:lysophospholipase L1-like esterase